MIKNYITVAKGINPPYKWFILDDEIDSNDCPFVTKKISIKHKEILDAYLKDSDSHISWKISDDSEIWHCRKPFIEEYKEIYVYRIIKEDKNNFKEYGFEADFKGEILKEYGSWMVGYIIINKGQAPTPCMWFNHNGEIDWSNKNYNLKPIKKEWYLDKDNFEAYKGKIIINKYGNIRMIQSIDENKVSTFEQNMYHDILKVEDWRPATKEEVLSLLVKD